MKVLLADDHTFVLSGVKAVLQDSAYDVVAVARTGGAVLDALQAAAPDILVLDVNMPERDGIEVLRTLREEGDRRPVILLTASLSNDGLLEALELGVEGIVLKDGAEHLLLHCLDEVAAGKRWIEPALLERALDIKLNAGRAKDGLSSLTPRERAVARLVAQGSRNRDIAAELGITEGTVKVYLHKIYEKVGAANRTELALLAREMGRK